MINTAVILAGGTGSRLKGILQDKPKGFIQIEEGINIIEYSINKLKKAGIENIIIGTGYSNQYYEELSKKYKNIKCKKNNDYETSGSMFTLYCLRDLIENDFLLLESDILYEYRGLEILLNIDKNDIILASSFTGSGDEVFIEVDDDRNLVKLSKNPDDIFLVYGELTGISKLSFNTYKELLKYCDENPQEMRNAHYESCLQKISGKNKIYVKKVNDYLWCEIDDIHHLKRAENIIFPKIKSSESIINIKRNVLLNPGPATTTNSVKLSQVVPDICPREHEFGNIMKYISNELTEVVGNTKDYCCVLFGGSGTASIEATISSVIPYSNDKKLLIVNNGAYGERMVKISKVYNMNIVEYKSSFFDPIDLNKLENVIQEEKMLSHLAVVHNETTTGLLNDINAISRICKKYSIEMIVDAVSSYACIPIDMKKMNINYLVSSSNKNIQGMAGISFVILNKKSLMKLKKLKPRNFYLSLYEQHQYFEKNHQMRFTPPVQTLYALKQAIIEFKMETIEKRHARYMQNWKTLIEGLDRIGLKHLVKEENHSKIITTIIEPENKKYNFNKMHDYLLKKGFTIYPGKVSDTPTFRIANIGAIDENDIKNFINELEKYFTSIGGLN